MRNLTKSEKLMVKENFDYQIGGILNMIEDRGLEAANITSVADAKKIVEDIANIALNGMRNKSKEICFTSTELKTFIDKLTISAIKELEEAIEYEL